jgi:hypothetical protein
MTCRICTQAAVKDTSDPVRDKALRAMALRGFINCKISEYRASFYPLDHVCPSFVQALPAVLAARQAWFERQAEQAEAV